MGITINGVLFEVKIDPGFPGVFGGPPDRWEPPEPAYIEEIQVYLKSKKIWKTITEELPECMEQKIWEAIDANSDQSDMYYDD